MPNADIYRKVTALSLGNSERMVVKSEEGLLFRFKNEM